MGKGDSPRPMNKKVYDANYERAFGKHKIKVWENAPKITEGSGDDGRQGDELFEGKGTTNDTQAPKIVDAEGSCPGCGCLFGWSTDPLFDRQNRCDRCGTTWDKRKTG